MDEPAALMAVTRTLRTLADGTVRVQLDIEPRDRSEAMLLLGEPGVAVALARLSAEASSPGMWGQEAKRLRQSGFFRAPDVWREVGSDESYLDWLRERPCAVCRAAPPSEAAHVRRVADGAGTAVKPAYSAIPLCHRCHHAQHQHGEGAIGGREVIDRARIRHVEQWAWETLKATLGYAHWNEVPPRELAAWADRHGVAHLLPLEYREEAA